MSEIVEYFDDTVGYVKDILEGPRDVVTAAEAVVIFFEMVWSAVKDWAFWLSMLWLALGTGLTVLAVWMWLRVENVPVPSIIPVPV